MSEQNKEKATDERPAFAVAFRGYSQGEVDDYLRLISKEIESLQIELRALKAERQDLLSQAERSQEVLLAAQRTAEDIRQNARRESEAMLREAENRAMRLEEEMRSRMAEMKFEYEQARKEYDEFLSNARNLAHSFIRKIDSTRGLG